MKIRHRSGFVLIEILAALSILAVAGLGIFFIGTLSTSSNLHSKDEASALALAVDKLESLRNSGFENLDSSGSPYSDASNPLSSAGVNQAGAPFSRGWTIADATLNGLPAKQLGVTVSWIGGGNVTLSTQIVKLPSGAAGTSTTFAKDWTQLR